MTTLNPARTLAELKELRAMTSDANGAQRVAWTDTWATARAWLRAKLTELPVEIQTDAAGNLWATLTGASEQALIIGGHIDSVPNGGWLDGSLDTLAGLEVLRRIAANGTPPVTVRLVDWADEEGVRFGRSLMGSSAFSGSLDLDSLLEARDQAGTPVAEVLSPHGVAVRSMLDARSQQANAAAYLELHIEQGPVLESLGMPLGVVLGTFGVERHRIIWHGQAAHAGATPMNRRKDALAGAAKLALALREIAHTVGDGGVCTSGGIVCKPGIPTAVVETAEQLLDQRHLDGTKLAQMLSMAHADSQRFAAEEGLSVTWERLWRTDPIPFHPELIDLAEQAIVATCGQVQRLASGPLHDAAEVARAGIPTVMLFVQSLGGISHNKIEDTHEEHILLAVEALDRLADATMAWINRA